MSESSRALLLDDNLMSAMRLQAQLERAGYVVSTNRTLPVAGEPASTEAEANAAPHLVVINLGSRGIDGVGLAAQSRERFSGARVIGFCGHLETEIRRAARAAGVDKILTNEQAFTDLAKSLER